MKKIGVIVNTKRLHASEMLDEVRRLAQKYNFSLFAENAAMASALDAELVPIEQFGEVVDVALAMGGDGTVLYASRALHGSDVPILGINLGSLGFLTSVGDSEIAEALEAIAAASCKISERMVSECRIFSGETLLGVESSLNDIVLGWGSSSRIVGLDLSIDAEAVGRFMCDGMIVSTPTGSTGHALSAGGPILHPGIAGFGINVICPHTLGSRPLVVPDSCRIVIDVVSAAKKLILSIDGQDEYTVERGARIEICKSPYSARFMQLHEHSYFSVLSQKLHWRGSAL